MKFKAGIICVIYIALSASPAFAAGDADKGKKVFNKCKACHMVGENAKKRVGPPLNNIIGAKAGVQEGYKYSSAMVAAGEGGMVWDEETLSAYLLKPRDVVPKGKMAFPGLKKESDRVNVIAYLKQFMDAQ
ncbi:MAG: cytochrome c family protein [Hyphomicrobiaceae bacterium]|nr:cytochrome c family protein [Hyphomicrobiaceae bacterium]